MTLLSIGDLAQSFMMRSRNFELKSQMSTLTAELSSGRTSDVGASLKGEFSYLADVERSMRVLSGYDYAISEAATYTLTMQNTLEEVQTVTSELAAELVVSRASQLGTALGTASKSAVQDLDQIVSALNRDIAGRSLFAGTATDTAPLQSGAFILSELRTAVAAETTVSDIVAAVDDWFFAAGGGFETTAYAGASDHLSPFQLGDNDSVQFAMKADDTEMRNLLRATAIAALSADETLGYSVVMQSQLQQVASDALFSAQADLTEIRADLGFVQDRIEESSVRNASARTGLEYARNDLLSADPYETATRLEHAQFQLESLYTLTVRMSRMTLTEYMR